MKFPKKILVFSFLFAVLAAAAVVMWFKGKPAASAVNPLKAHDIGKFNSIMIENILGTTTLQQKDGKWLVTQPVNDTADPHVMDHLLSVLKTFAIGSVISNNPNNFGTFDLDQEHVGHVQVYVQGENQPVLDMYAGKTMTGGDCYVHLAGDTRVRVAENLPCIVFHVEPNTFRFSKIFSVDPLQADKITIQWQKRTWAMVRSSQTWNFTGLKTQVHPEEVRPIIERMKNWNVSDFDPGPEGLEMADYKNPYMLITLETPGGPYQATIGTNRVTVSQQGQTLTMRYVKVEGRDANMLTPSHYVEELLATLEKIK